MASRNVSAGRILEVLASGRSALRGRDERVVVRVHVHPHADAGVAVAPGLERGGEHLEHAAGRYLAC